MNASNLKYYNLNIDDIRLEYYDGCGRESNIDDILRIAPAVSNAVDAIAVMSEVGHAVESRFDREKDGKKRGLDEAIKRLSNSAEGLYSALSEHAGALDAVHREAESYFMSNSGWKYEDVCRAVDEFEVNGFRSKTARKFAMFIRNSLVDDPDRRFKNVVCISVSADMSFREFDAYIMSYAMFEESGTGWQFAVGIPFTAPSFESGRLLFGSSLSDLGPQNANYYMRGMVDRQRNSYLIPGYSLSIPNGMGDRKTVVTSFDPSVVRRNVAGFLTWCATDARGQTVESRFFGKAS